MPLDPELSWLAFNDRVLHEALRERQPLLERLRFLAIAAANLDQFFSRQVADLRRHLRAPRSAADESCERAKLRRIEQEAQRQLVVQSSCLAELFSRLAVHDIGLVATDELSVRERAAMDEFYVAAVHGYLSPVLLSADAHIGPHPTPTLFLLLTGERGGGGDTEDVIIGIPTSVPRFIPVLDRPGRVLPVEQVVAAHAARIVSRTDLRPAGLFRATWSYQPPADTGSDDAHADAGSRKASAPLVRLEAEWTVARARWQRVLQVLRGDAIPWCASAPTHPHALLGLADLEEIYALGAPALKQRRIRPAHAPPPPPSELDGRSLFAVLRERDLLLHHPFVSFSGTVERFFGEAARDPDVTEIKLTIYRTTEEAAMLHALADAVRNGKRVTALVEARARASESCNRWIARTLGAAGVDAIVVTSPFKLHAKLALITRQEDGAIRRYAHISSGNYNPATAERYTDIGLLTCDSDIAQDLDDTFDAVLQGRLMLQAGPTLRAPCDLRSQLVALIDREAGHARAGRPARMIAKMNTLTDLAIAEALYNASCAGVEIDLVVRGVCVLRPGVPGLSDRIRVRSVVGQLLEHSRCWLFANDGDTKVYIGSADWMPRTFERRIEVVVPITDARLRRRVASILLLYLADNKQSWLLQPNGEWRRACSGTHDVAAHEVLMRDPYADATAVLATTAPRR